MHSLFQTFLLVWLNNEQFNINAQENNNSHGLYNTYMYYICDINLKECPYHTCTCIKTIQYGSIYAGQYVQIFPFVSSVCFLLTHHSFVSIGPEYKRQSSTEHGCHVISADSLCHCNTQQGCCNGYRWPWHPWSNPTETTISCPCELWL